MKTPAFLECSWLSAEDALRALFIKAHSTSGAALASLLFAAVSVPSRKAGRVLSGKKQFTSVMAWRESNLIAARQHVYSAKGTFLPWVMRRSGMAQITNAGTHSYEPVASSAISIVSEVGRWDVKGSRVLEDLKTARIARAAPDHPADTSRAG